MADTLDPAALRKTAGSIMEGCAFPNCEHCTLARALLQHLDREAAAQQVLATMAPRLEDVQQRHVEAAFDDIPYGAAEMQEDRAYLLSVVDALAGQAANLQQARDLEVQALKEQIAEALRVAAGGA